MRCTLCDTTFGLTELLDHLRVMHPDMYEPPESWPDGGPVITFAEITVDDIQGGA